MVNQTVGIVGAAGSGKSTLVDVILGLIDPRVGLTLVDDQLIFKSNVRQWQDSIGLVPQSVFKTTIMVARHLKIVENCDVIFMLEDGQLRNQGTYFELLNNNKKFQ